MTARDIVALLVGAHINGETGHIANIRPSGERCFWRVPLAGGGEFRFEAEDGWRLDMMSIADRLFRPDDLCEAAGLGSEASNGLIDAIYDVMDGCERAWREGLVQMRLDLDAEDAVRFVAEGHPSERAAR